MVRVRMLAAAVAAILVPALTFAQDAQKTREQVKAETRAAQQAGEMTPAGGGATPAAKTSTKHSTVTKEKRKAETLEARKKGELVPAGGGGPAPSK